MITDASMGHRSRSISSGMPGGHRVGPITIDHALTRPWTVDKRYVRNANPRPDWPEYYITEGNAQIGIGKENYFLSAEGLLMPAKKDQAPPDLKYFNPARK